MKRKRHPCIGSKCLMNYDSHGQLEVSVAVFKSNNRPWTRFEKQPSKADMDKQLVTTAKSITTHFREVRKLAGLKDKMIKRAFLAEVPIQG